MQPNDRMGSAALIEMRSIFLIGADSQVGADLRILCHNIGRLGALCGAA